MKRNTRRGRRRNGNPTDESQKSATLYSSEAGRKIPDHELTTFAPSNQVRRFDLDEPSNGPSMVYRKIHPYAGFVAGFSNGSISDQDTDAAYDITAADPKAALYPITLMAESFEQDVFPILLNLFASGTGKRYEVTINEIERTIAMSASAYFYLLMPLLINKLTFHTDWSKIAPFSNTVPSHLYKVAENMDATDIGVAETWYPRMRRMDNLTMFPRMLDEIKRMMTPMMAIDLHGRVDVPVFNDPSTVTASTIISAVDGYLDYIDTHLADASNLMATFLPFPMMAQNPWEIADLPTIDVDRNSGLYNSGTKVISSFGDTGDPDKQVTILFDEAESLEGLFFTRHCQPIWSEMKLTTMFWLEDHVTDDTFKLITPHKYDKAILIDDAFDSFAYDGTPLTTASVGFRYLDYITSRFAGKSIDFGCQKAGTFGSTLDYASLQRMMRLETSYVFSVEALKQVSSTMAGSSLREIRSNIRDLVYKTTASGL